MSSVIERLNSALGRSYRVERELGQGGMATVYLAEDLKHGRNVAIKVLRPQLAAVIAVVGLCCGGRTVFNGPNRRVGERLHLTDLFAGRTADCLFGERREGSRHRD